MILLTGATGQVGRYVLQEMRSRATEPLRIMCRSEKDLAALPAGVAGVKGDFADKPSLAAALSGVDSAFLVCAPVATLVELETNFLQACKTAGVKHLVIHSALGAGDFPRSFPSWHRKVEDTARSLGIPSVILRPNGFMQNIGAFWAPTIRSQDAFYDSVGDAKISFIDIRDVASAVAAALLDYSTAGNVYELSGPAAFTHDQIAALLSKTTGRTIRYVNLPAAQLKAGMLAAGMPENQATAILDLNDYYISGKGEASDASLRSLLAHNPPRTLENYLAENAPAFAKSPA